MERESMEFDVLIIGDGPALLVSEEAALPIVRKKIPLSFANEFYTASEQLITMRINVTGARKRANRFRGPK